MTIPPPKLFYTYAFWPLIAQVFKATFTSHFWSLISVCGIHHDTLKKVSRRILWQNQWRLVSFGLCSLYFPIALCVGHKSMVHHACVSST